MITFYEHYIAHKTQDHMISKAHSSPSSRSFCTSYRLILPCYHPDLTCMFLSHIPSQNKLRKCRQFMSCILKFRYPPGDPSLKSYKDKSLLKLIVGDHCIIISLFVIWLDSLTSHSSCALGIKDVNQYS